MKDQQQRMIRTISMEVDPDKEGSFLFEYEGFVELDDSQTEFQIISWKNVDHENAPKWRFGGSFREDLDRETLRMILTVFGGFMWNVADELVEVFFNFSTHH